MESTTEAAVGTPAEPLADAAANYKPDVVSATIAYVATLCSYLYAQVLV